MLQVKKFWQVLSGSLRNDTHNKRLLAYDMSLIDSLAFFVIMITLSAIPGASVALVVTRSISLGIGNGLAVILGIVLADLLFILFAILGLSALAEAMGSLFLVIRYIAGAYLVWLGYSLLIVKNKTVISLNKSNSTGSLASSFLAGFFLTLGDIKAIFFYASLLPGFIELSSLNVSDTLSIITITIISVGGVKIAYAVSAIKAINIPRISNFENMAKKTAGVFMLGAGSYLIIKA